MWFKMKQWIALALAIALVGGLTACKEATPQKNSSQAENPNPTVVIYEESVDQALADSPLYQQALAQPSVIIYNEAPLTDSGVVDRFLKAVEEKGDGELYLYSFNAYDDGTSSCFLNHFVCQGGTVTQLQDRVENWNDSLSEENSYPVNSISLNQYGYLVYEAESSSEIMGTQVINDHALYEDADQRQEMWETYLRPIFYTALGNQQWSSPAELTSWIWLFEDLYNYENGTDPWSQYGSDWPVGEMTTLLSKYFDGVTAQMVAESAKGAYDAATDTIHYEGGRGGGPFCLRVTGWHQDGDQLAIEYEHYDYATGVPYEDAFYTVTVRTLEDGSFRYLSNQPRAAA